ncbi:MAG: UvrD-helicase domain-containing protein, partial [Bacteroidales bacterium]|nr:UvrD-helicase domain-containing protein [Bacteroidales bacterium]
MKENSQFSILNSQLNNSFIVYQASAGSGKTYTLAKEYIKHCLIHFEQDPFIYRKILAVTFTNKAVNEMKERILLFLEALSEGRHDNLLKELSEWVDEKEIPIRSAKILNRIHHDYGNFSICTIDSLFQRIVQSFAVDLKIPLDHQLELDADVMTSMIVDLILGKLGYDLAVTEAVVNFSFANIEEEKNWKTERELTNIGKQIYSETAIACLRKLQHVSPEDFATIIKQIRTELAVTENKIKEAARNACGAIERNDIQITDFYQGTKGVGQWFYKLNSGDYSKLSGNSYVVKAIDENTWYSKSCTKKEAIDSITPVLSASYTAITTAKAPYELLKAIRKTIYPVALLNEMKNTAEELKRNDKLIHISEANAVISQHIQNEPVPFIYERMGDRYNCIFIDEFQDTSAVQWQNLLPLVTEALSSYLSENEAGKTIIFGDAKQAIYRFRGGDVRQFVALPELKTDNNPILREREGILKYHYKKMLLDKNYRSKKEIVDFNNAFFSYLTENETEAVKEIYRDVAQIPKEDALGGAVFLSYLDKDEKTETTYIDYVLKEIHRIITSLQKDKYSYDDVAVLVRGNEFGSEIARYLVQQHIPTISGESLLLSKNREVNFLIACLSYLTNPCNEIARIVILRFISEERNVALEEMLICCKSDASFLQFIHQQGFSFEPDNLRKQNLYEQTEQLLQVFSLTEQANPFILTFLNIVADFVQTVGKTEAQFLQYWKEQEKKFSLSNPKGINAVTVMSVHQSKGLEFPVVIYPHKQSPNRMGAKWVDLEPPVGNLSTTLLNFTDMKETVYHPLYEEEKQLIAIDELNVDYVACTRAKDRLYFIAQEKDKRGDALADFLQSYPENNNLPPERSDCFYACWGNPQPQTVDPDKTKKEESRLQTYTSRPLSVELRAAGHFRFGMRDAHFQARAWGTKIHDYLARIYRRSDVERLLDEIRNDNSIESGFKTSLGTIIRNVFSHAKSDLLFGNENSILKNELELINTDGTTFRIDRLRIDGSRCTLFDYKTGMITVGHY